MKKNKKRFFFIRFTFWVEGGLIGIYSTTGKTENNRFFNNKEEIDLAKENVIKRHNLEGKEVVLAIDWFYEFQNEQEYIDFGKDKTT